MNLNELIKKYKIFEEMLYTLQTKCSNTTFYRGQQSMCKKTIKDLEELKKTQLQNLNEVKAYLRTQKVTPEMVAIAMRKIEISILGDDKE